MDKLFKEIEAWYGIYEFSFQFWGKDSNNCRVYKNDVELYDSGGFETPKQAIEAALKYVNKINP